MGLMRFLVPEPHRVSALGLECAHLAAPEGVAWRTWVSWSDNVLTCRRDEDDSGVFFVPWLVDGLAVVVPAIKLLHSTTRPGTSSYPSNRREISNRERACAAIS